MSIKSVNTEGTVFMTPAVSYAYSNLFGLENSVTNILSTVIYVQESLLMKYHVKDDFCLL